VQGAVLMPSVRVGHGAIVRNAILDKNVVVEPGAQIGVDLERDRMKYTISPSGIVVVGKGQIVTNS
jgi:glucose-1-phosphate adenylyltransferase